MGYFFLKAEMFVHVMVWRGAIYLGSVHRRHVYYEL